MATEYRLYAKDKDGNEVEYADCPSVRYTGTRPEDYEIYLAALPGVTRVEVVSEPPTAPTSEYDGLN